MYDDLKIMGNAVSDYLKLTISVESGYNEFGMRDCMKLLISSFLDNILYKCRMHVFLNYSWLNAVEWCHYSKCWLYPKGDNVL